MNATGPLPTAAASLVPYDFALLRVVPHPHTGAFVHVGVVVHARTAEFLGLRATTDETALRRLAPDVDVELLARYLRCYEQIAAGEPTAGPVALLPRSERFHWLTAPRSDVLQPSPVHVGLAASPAEALEALFRQIAG
jgi:hypothetical protein